MAEAVSALLDRLAALKTVFGEDVAAHKLELLAAVAPRRLATADAVLRLHELLCFWQAYPDSRELLAEVERLLNRFADRADLRRFRGALADTGVAGTDTYYSFFWPTALWLVQHHPDSLEIDWREFAQKETLTGLLPVLMPYAESPAFDQLAYSAREWLERLKGAGETDAAFLVRRFAALAGSSFTRESLYEMLDVPIRLRAGPKTPARGAAKLSGFPVVLQTQPLVRQRPNLRQDVLRPPLRVRAVSPQEGQRIIDASVEAMITRARDLDAFAWGDPRDVRLVDCGDGLQFACIGQTPERRLLFEAVYGFLTIKNGVPIGYVLASSLFRSTEVAYNVFETFRGAEAAPIFGRVLAMVKHLFGAEAFSIDPYQLGHDNAEGLQSGAWWFYYKLGFRPEEPEVRRLLAIELAKMRKNPRHRSSVATLQRLSAAHVFLYLDGKKRADVLAKVPIGELGLRISDLLARRCGGHRERGLRELAREAETLLGVRSQRRWTTGERLAWKRWSPLIVQLPGVKRWSPASRRALVQVVRAKGGRRESDFVASFDAHKPLQRALLKLAAEGA